MTTKTLTQPKKQTPPQADSVRAKVDEIRSLARAEDRASRFRERLDEKGKPVLPDSTYFEKLEAWLSSYCPRALPIAQRQMQELRDAYDLVKSLDPGDQTFFGGREQYVWLRYWNCRDAAQAACFREPPTPVVRKTPTQLRAENVSAAQAAYEWIWKLPDGSPDIARVERELANPGSELTPEAIAERHQRDLEILGFTYVAPPAPDVSQLKDELTSVSEYLASLESRVAEVRQEHTRLKGLLAQAAESHE
jgi:hypothetical protein